MSTRKAKAAKQPPEPDTPPAEDLGILSGDRAKGKGIGWDWPGMIVRHALNLIDGQKGTGKSSVMATIAATLAAGKRLPESKGAGRKGSCLWFGSEESFGGSIVPRWKANGGDVRQIHTVTESAGSGVGRLMLPCQEERLRAIVRATGAVVLVADPYTALGEPSLDTRHEQSTRLYLESLARVAGEEGVTVLLARHLRKGRSGGLLEHGLGSVAIPNVCRSVLRVERSRESPAVCYLACVACNHGKAPGVVPYTLAERDGNVFAAKFAARKDDDLEDVLEGDEDDDERDRLGDARRLLAAALKDGPVDAAVLIGEAMKNGIGERTLRKAKAEMRVVSKRISAGKGVAANWKWSLPAAK